MNDCDTCIYLTYDEISLKWVCNKGNDVFNQMFSDSHCPMQKKSYKSLGRV